LNTGSKYVKLVIINPDLFWIPAVTPAVWSLSLSFFIYKLEVRVPTS
jgi:hypothetical protein